MTSARRIYWFLFWGLSYETLNRLVRENIHNKSEVEFYCKVIALKSINKNLDEVWEEATNVT